MAFIRLALPLATEPKRSPNKMRAFPFLALVAAVAGEGNCTNAANWPGSIPRVVETSGHGEVQVAPDSATLVVNFNAFIKNVSSGSSTAVTTLVASQGAVFLAQLSELGVHASNISQLQFSVGERYDWTTGISTLIGFEAHNSYDVRIANLTMMADIVNAALDAGGLVSSSTFNVSPELSSFSRLAALTLASSNARERATAIAVGVGAGIGATRSISEAGIAPSVYHRPRAVAFDAASVRVGEEAFASDGLATISADVSASFDLK